MTHFYAGATVSATISGNEFPAFLRIFGTTVITLITKLLLFTNFFFSILLIKSIVFKKLIIKRFFLKKID